MRYIFVTEGHKVKSSGLDPLWVWSIYMDTSDKMQLQASDSCFSNVLENLESVGFCTFCRFQASAAREGAVPLNNRARLLMLDLCGNHAVSKAD